MRTQYTFRHMDSNDELKEHTDSKLDRLTRFEDREMAVHVTFSVEKFHKTVELQATGANGTFVSKETREDMYEAIDLAIDKLDRQLARDKDRRKHYKGNQAATPHEVRFDPGSVDDDDDDEFEQET